MKMTCAAAEPAFIGYQKGVPMGGDLSQGSIRKGAEIYGLCACAIRLVPISIESRSSRVGLDKDGKTHEAHL